MHPRIVGRPPRRTLVGSTSLRRYDPGAMRQPAKNDPCEKFAIAGARSSARESRALPRRDRAFTLIELLVVIAIIAILIGLFFPAFSAVQNQARKAQAKNDLTQIVNAVNAYYTEYGNNLFPSGQPQIITPMDLGATQQTITCFTRWCHRGGSINGSDVNPRKIVFINPPSVKIPQIHVLGFGYDGNRAWSILRFLGSTDVIRIDSDYNNQLTNPYTADTWRGNWSRTKASSRGRLGSDGRPGYNGGTTMF